MKREFPLFIYDNTRSHKLGECDFVVCTDLDNGFVAKIDYVDADKSYVDDDTRIEVSNGIGARMSIKRIIGNNPNKESIRTLMKKCMALYMSMVRKTINVDEPSTQDCIDFLDILISGNKHNIDACGSDYNERKTVLASISMLETIKTKIIENNECNRE